MSLAMSQGLFQGFEIHIQHFTQEVLGIYLSATYQMLSLKFFSYFDHLILEKC